MAIKRLSNGRWEATYRDPGNKERQGTFPNQREAKAWLAANNSDIARGTWIDPRAGRIILRGYADKWIGTRTDIRLSTAAKYRQLLAQHVLPTLGSHTLVALSPSAVRAWWAKLHGQYPATAANAYRLLSTICNTAVEDGLIAKSPCRVKGAGADRAAERPVGSIAEIDAAAAAAPGHWRLAILLAFWCQLRRGEVLALQRKDFDELHGTLSVCHHEDVPTGVEFR